MEDEYKLSDGRSVVLCAWWLSQSGRRSRTCVVRNARKDFVNGSTVSLFILNLLKLMVVLLSTYNKEVVFILQKEDLIITLNLYK